MPEQTVLIPCSTILGEKRRKWYSDDGKVINWEQDEHADNNSVRFTFYNYSKYIDKSVITYNFADY